MLVVKMYHGDAYAEIIRAENGTLLNLKPLDPHSMRTVTDDKGLVVRYEQRTKTGQATEPRKLAPSTSCVSSLRVVGRLNAIFIAT